MTPKPTPTPPRAAKTQPVKPRRRKPRKLWYSPAWDGFSRTRVFTDSFPVLVIDLRPESVAALGHKMADAFDGSYDGHLHKTDITALLRAIHPALSPARDKGGKGRK